jgi:hypothetical protein
LVLNVALACNEALLAARCWVVHALAVVLESAEPLASLVAAPLNGLATQLLCSPCGRSQHLDATLVRRPIGSCFTASLWRVQARLARAVMLHAEAELRAGWAGKQSDANQLSPTAQLMAALRVLCSCALPPRAAGELCGAGSGGRPAAHSAATWICSGLANSSLQATLLDTMQEIARLAPHQLLFGAAPPASPPATGTATSAATLLDFGVELVRRC